MKAAELNLAAEKATAEDEKASLLEQKAAAEAEAKAAARSRKLLIKLKQASQSTNSYCFWKYNSYGTGSSISLLLRLIKFI